MNAMPLIMVAIVFFQGIVNLSLTGSIMIFALSIFFDAVPKWISAFNKKIPVTNPEPVELLVK